MENSVAKEMDKKINQILLPVLKEDGFSQHKGRNFWAQKGDFIWVFHIRAVGNHHSLVTGWPSSSISVYLGGYNKSLSTNSNHDNKGVRFLPKEYECHNRAKIYCGYRQLKYTKYINGFHGEKTRKDIWWVKPDGSNLDEVVNDIKDGYIKDGSRWFRKKSTTLISKPNFFRHVLAFLQASRVKDLN